MQSRCMNVAFLQPSRGPVDVVGAGGTGQPTAEEEARR